MGIAELIANAWNSAAATVDQYALKARKGLKSSDLQSSLFDTEGQASLPGMGKKSSDWDEDAHPRAAKGSTGVHGGQFVKKDESPAVGGKESADELRAEKRKHDEANYRKHLSLLQDEALDRTAEMLRNSPQSEESQMKLAAVSEELSKRGGATKRPKGIRDPLEGLNVESKQPNTKALLDEMLSSGQSMVKFAAAKNLSQEQRKALFEAYAAHNEAKRAPKPPSEARAAAMAKATAREKSEQKPADSLAEQPADKGPIPIRERKTFAESLAKQGKSQSEIAEAMVKRGVALSDANRLASKATGDQGPKDGDVNADGLVFRNGRWHREDAEKENKSEEKPKATQKVASSTEERKAIESLKRIDERTAKRPANNYDVDQAFKARELLFSQGWSSEDIENAKHEKATPKVASLSDRQSDLERIHKEKSDALKAIPGVGTGSMGITPDAVKKSDEYKLAKAEQDEAWNNLREFNRTNSKAMKQERSTQSQPLGNQSKPKPADKEPESAKDSTPLEVAKPAESTEDKLDQLGSVRENAINQQKAKVEKPAERPALEVATPADNSSAKSGDQLGLFGEVANVKKTEPPKLDSVGETKGRSQSLFDTKGDPDQMMMFDDGVTPEDRLLKVEEPKAKAESPKRKTYEQMKSEVAAIKEQHADNPGASSRAYGKWLNSLSPEEAREYIDTDGKERRFARRSKAAKKGATTKNRNSDELERKMSDPAGKVLAETQDKIDSLMRQWQVASPSRMKEIDEEVDRLTEKRNIANDHWRLRENHRRKDQEPHNLRRNDSMPDLGSEENKQATTSNRESDLIPWTVGYKGDSGETRYTIAGASLSDSVTSKGVGVIHLKDANGTDSTRDGLLIHFDRGDQEKNKRARQLVWAIGNGKAKDASLEDLQRFVMGDSLDHWHPDYDKTPNAKKRKSAAEVQKNSSRLDPAIVIAPTRFRPVLLAN